MPRNPGTYIVAAGSILAIGLTFFIPVATASRNSAGTYSLPSGNPVVSGQPVSSSWANTTLADLAAEVTNSLDRNGRGAMAAPLQLSTGSCAAPSLTFSADTDVGMYRAASNDTRMCIASTAVQHWTATGASFPLGLTATALSSGAGVVGTATSTAGSIGVKGVATDRLAIKGQATTGTGVWGEATGSGTGVSGTSTSGFGVYGESASAPGMKGVSTSSYGLHAMSSSSYGVFAESTTGNAIGVGAGHIKMQGTMSGGATPWTEAYTNTLTPLNIPKTWARVTCSGTCSIVSGFNVASVATGGSLHAEQAELTLAGNVSGTYGAVAMYNGGSQQVVTTVQPIDADTIRVRIHDPLGAFNMASSGDFTVVVFGAQ